MSGQQLPDRYWLYTVTRLVTLTDSASTAVTSRVTMGASTTPSASVADSITTLREDGSTLVRMHWREGLEVEAAEFYMNLEC